MPLDGAFTALLLIICGVSSVTVPPPSNVTVSCQNLQTTVSWDYSKHQPHTIFRVNITGVSLRSFEVNTTDHHYDLSHFVWESQEHYLASLCVIVTAVQGGKQSEAVRSKLFSYNYLLATNIKCMLDFPPLVKVHVTEEGASVSFPNPLRFYKELKRIIEQDSSSGLKYSVSSAANSFEGFCHLTDTKCKLDVTFADGKEECVTLKGDWTSGRYSVNPVKFRETEKFCSEKENGVFMLAVMLGFIFIVVLIVAVVIILKVNAWTMNTPTPPKNLNNMWADSQQGFCTIPLDPEKISLVTAFKPTETTSIDSDKCSKHLQASNISCDHDPCAVGFYPARERFQRNSDFETVDFMSGANGTDEDSADGSVKTECFSISSTDEEISTYDRRHVVLTDMGDGDMVTGYTGN